MASSRTIREVLGDLFFGGVETTTRGGSKAPRNIEFKIVRNTDKEQRLAGGSSTFVEDGGRFFDVLDPEGNPIATIETSHFDPAMNRVNPEHLEVEMIEALTKGGGVGSLSPKGVRDVLAQLREEFPESKTIGGFRISGAREQAGSTGRVTMKLNEMLAAAGLGGSAALLGEEAQAADFDTLIAQLDEDLVGVESGGQNLTESGQVPVLTDDDEEEGQTAPIVPIIPGPDDKVSVQPPIPDPIGPGVITSIEEAQQVQIVPTFDEVIEEVVRGYEITKNQVQEFLTQARRKATIGDVPETTEEFIRRFESAGPISAPPLGKDDVGAVQGRLDVVNRMLEEEEQALQSQEAKFRERIEQEVGTPADSVGGAVIRNMTRFAMYAPIFALTRRAGIGPATSAIVGGTTAAQLAFEADEPRLANLLAEAESPVLNNAFVRFMQADPDDPQVIKEFKQAIEETILGVAGVGLAAGVRIGGTASREAIKRARGIYNEAVKLKRQRTASSIGQSEDTQPLTSAFRRDISEADAEVARVADELLRRPRPEGVDLETHQAALRADFESEILRISEKYAKDIPGGRAKPFTRRDVAAKLEVFNKRLTAGEVPPGTSPQRVEEINRRLEENDAAVEEAMKTHLSDLGPKIRRELREGIVDRSGTIKREILAEGGMAADRAVRNFEIARGANVAAQYQFDAAYRRIFQDLSRSERGDLAELIRLRRMREIKSYRPDWQPPFAKKGEDWTAEDFHGALLDFRKRVGEEQYAKLSTHADDYFAQIIQPLDVLRDTGVISAKEHSALSRFQFSPIEFIEELDPTIATISTRGRPVSVSSSGIAPLKKGDRDLMLNNPDAFLGEVIARAYSRAFRNRANQGLYKFAEAKPTNPTVRTSKPKEGDWTQVSVMFDGEKKSLYIRSDLVQGWMMDPIGVPMWAQIISGNFAVRPLATGALAPEFAPVNFAYDIMYAIMTAGSGKLYSPLLPKAGIQLASDLRATARDAFTRSGAFDDYINQGGGMALLTHQGDVIQRSAEQLARHPTARALHAFERYAGYLNESVEVWMRLAIRNRVLRNRMRDKGFITPDDQLDATWEARRYLDFSQGGRIVKALDHFIPYTNAAVQGFRGAGRAIKESPAAMTAKFSQAMGMFASLWYANHLVNPEAFESVPDNMKANNLIITTPFYRFDREGNKRFLYFSIPLEHTMRPVNAIANSMMARTLTGEPPDDETMNVIRGGSSILPGVGSFPPSITAAIALAGNFDWWRGEKIWRGDTSLPPTYERIVTGEDPTTQLSMDLAEGVNPLLEGAGLEDLRISPERMDVAARALFPRSVYTDVVGAGYKTLTEGLDQQTKDLHAKHMHEVLSDAPFLRRYLRETHPFTRNVEALQKAQEVASAEAFLRREEIRRQIDNFRVQGEFGPRQYRMIEGWIREQDPIYQPGLSRYLKEQIKLNEVFQRFDPDQIPGVPSRTWWSVLSGARPAARAAAFWDHWVDAHNSLDSDDKETAELAQQKLRLMRALMRSVPGFNPRTSQEFGLEMERLSRESQVPLP